jgi:membrane-bound serine protease (ClpP class)
MLAQALGITFAIFLFVLCAMLLVLEIFIPSLGLITVLALACLAGGIYLFFQVSVTVGWIGVWTAAILIPVVWIIVYKLLPKTKIGQILELKKTGDAVPGIPDQENLNALVGQTGIVVTPLRPVGTCEFGGKKVTCVSEADFLTKNITVKVIHVEGNKVTVRKLDSV